MVAAGSQRRGGRGGGAATTVAAAAAAVTATPTSSSASAHMAGQLPTCHGMDLSEYLHAHGFRVPAAEGDAALATMATIPVHQSSNHLLLVAPTALERNDLAGGGQLFHRRRRRRHGRRRGRCRPSTCPFRGACAPATGPPPWRSTGSHPPPPPLMAAATNGAAAIDGGGVRTRHTGTEPKDGEPVNTEGPPRA